MKMEEEDALLIHLAIHSGDDNVTLSNGQVLPVRQKLSQIIAKQNTVS